MAKLILKNDSHNKNHNGSSWPKNLNFMNIFVLMIVSNYTEEGSLKKLIVLLDSYHQ